MKEMKKNLMIIFAASMLISGCAQRQQEDQQQVEPAVVEGRVVLTSTQIKNAEITFGKPESRAMASTLKLNGVVETSPSSMVYVSNPFGGFVKATNLIPGQKVKKGELLLVMEDPQYIQLQHDYLIAKSRLAFLELDYRRQRDLNADKSISDKVFQQAGSDYTSQKILLKSLYEKLKLVNINPETLTEDKISRSMSIYSPIEGYVSEVNISVGKYVNSTEALVGLTDEKILHASLTVFEKDIPFVSVGQKIIVTSPSRPGKKFDAIVHIINRSLGADRSSEVHCDFSVSDKDLYPGMFITAEVAIQSAEVVVVPESSVVTWNDKHYVFSRVGDNAFEMTPVETGVVNDGYVEIKDSLHHDIVTTNAYSLLMELKVDAE